jgi:thiamine transport system ATP-binding protein
MSLELDGIVVRFANRTVLDALSFTVPSGSITCVLGPSGCGKSTLLRVVAGLLIPDRGRVRIDGADVTTVAPHRRRVGFVFQDDVLFPHLDVGENIAFGLRLAGVARAGRVARVGELLNLVGLPGYERRDVATLSGGEAQRVALARALAPSPKVVLLDEPFGALDRDLHDALVPEVRRLLGVLGTTALHVTHDRDEATLMGDELITL